VALTFFNDQEAQTVEAFAERIIPDDGSGTGARAAGVVYYIDRAVGGFSANLQAAYRLGLKELGRFCQQRAGRDFVDLAPAQQDEIVRQIIGPETGAPPDGFLFSPDDQQHEPPADAELAPIDSALLQRIGAIIREHAVEGFFCDPVYGGNRDAVGWKLVGFPGAYWGYTAQQMAAGFDGRTLPIKTLSDLRAELRSLPDNSTFNRDEE
jgi:gluconate 2-dehydrogenase gamma chain